MEIAPTSLLGPSAARRLTPEFQAWFQNSQVVTPAGEPLVVYHGTPQHVMNDGSVLGDLTEFDRLFTVHNLRGRKVSMDNVGSWFSTNPSADGGAGMYAGNGAIYPVHLSIQNCFVTTFELLAKKMHELNGDHAKAAARPVTAIGDPSNLRTWLKASGFDGIKIIHDPSRPSSQEFALQDAWIPLDAAQIKSAVGNHGAYSPYSTDIRFSEVDDADHEAEHGKALDETGFWGRQAAGCVVLARSTGRLLIAQRSDFVLEPGTWGTWGGAIDENEDPELATLRELQEEAGLPQAAQILPLLVFQKRDFKYHNFLVVIEDEFQPELNWESQGSVWVTLDDMPAPLHPGLQALLADAASMDVIRLQAKPAPLEATQTESFQRWFSESKVVDGEGNPGVRFSLAQDLSEELALDPAIQKFKTAVLDLAYGEKGIERIKSDGMLAATVKKGGRPIFVVRGVFGREQFRQAMAEASAAGIEFDKMYVFADLATYSGRSIDFMKLDEVLPSPPTLARLPAVEPTQTSEFQAWFEGSKVVDREGEPLVVFHGSTKDVAKFRVEGEGSTYGAGVYFGGADDANSFADLGNGADGVVYPVYLSLRNPLTIIVPEGHESPGGEAVVYKLPEELRGNLAEAEEYGGELRDAVIAAGYDGIVVHHGDGRSEYVAYHAEQIRSALSRTFDAPAPGIRFSLVEDVEAPVRRVRRFQTWFNGSKVVDANGAPLRVYRGEHGDTDDGEPRTFLDSYTFTVDASVASTYAMQPNNWRAFPEAVSPRVVAAYLAIKNPVFFNDDDPFVEFSDLEKSLGRPLAEKMARKHDNDVRNTGNWEDNFADRFDTVDELLDHHPEALGALYVDAYVLLDDPEFIYSAKEAGFDGAAHLGNGESALVMEYRAFDKAQIKSATGNNGEFDPSNPGIRFSVGDAAKTAVNFDAAVDQVLSPGANLREQILVSTAVSSLIRMGLPARPVYTSARVIEKMRMDHGLSALEIKSLPALLADPVMVFKSNTQDGRYVAVTDVIRNDKPLIVALEPNGKAGRLDVMYVPSAYLKQDVTAFERWIRGGLLLFANKRKSQQLATTTRLKLPGVVQQAVGFSVAKYITERDMVQPLPKPAEEIGTRDSRNSLSKMAMERSKTTIAAMRAVIGSMVGMNGGELFQEGGKFIVVTSDQIPQAWVPLVGKNVLASLGADPRSQPAQIARRAAVNVGDAIERSAYTAELLQQVAAGTITYHQANAQVMSYDRTTSFLRAVGKKSAQAFYDGESDVTAFIADRINAGEEEAVFMHETVHKYGLPALGQEMWGSLVARLKAWSTREKNSVERQIYTAAERRAGKASVEGQAYDEELVAYACEEAVKRGIVPSAEAEAGSAEAWLSAVVDSIRAIGAKLIDNDLANLSAQDLVDLTYALAQLNSPERAERVKDAMGQELDAFFAALKVAPGAGGPMWYSSLERALQAAPMNSAPAADWSKFIDGLTGRGIKTDEIEWSGVHDWLAIQSGRVTKAAIVGYLKDYGVRIDEVILGGTAATSEADQALVNLDALGFTLDYDANMETAQLYRRRDRVTFFYDADEEAFVREDGHDEQLSDRVTQLALRLQELRPTQTHSGALETTRYSAYTLPGGSNYSELLLTLPARFGALSEDGLQELNAQMLAKFGEGLYEDQIRALKTGQAEALEMLDDWEVRMGLDVQRARLELQGEVRAETVFTTLHWDRPNVIAHVRFNERVDVDGAKCLFIEELQSDWGHDGKNKGFAGARPELEGRQEAAIRVRYAELQAERPQLFQPETPTLEGMMQNMGTIEMRAAFAAAGIQQDLADDFHPTNYSVPRGPFVGTTDAWLALVLKRIIKLAVDGGYERVAFVSGQQSVDRYDLSRLVDTIYYRKGEGPGYYLTIVSKERDETTHIDVTSADQLPEYVGQELAARIIAGEGELSNPALGTKAFRGLDLQLGGEGMKTFYDSIVPIAVTKLLRKLGGEGLTTVMVDDTHSLCSQVGFDITPAMRAKVTGGMPLFSLPADELIDLAIPGGNTRCQNRSRVANAVLSVSEENYSPFP